MGWDLSEVMIDSMRQSRLRLSLVTMAIGLLVLTSRGYENKVASFHFVDEEDNFVLGYYLLKGETLYSDLFSHHQPLAYILSAGIQGLTQPNSIFLLVKRHREMIMLWAAIWMIWLVIRFGWSGLIGVGVYELTKYNLLGSLFLAESISVYMLIYLAGLVIEDRKKDLRILEAVGLGSVVASCLLLLSPAWPLIIVSYGLIVWRQQQRRKFLSFSLMGGLPVLGLASFFMSIPDYFHNAFYINFRYYIPITSDESFLVLAVKSLFSPISVFFPNQTINLTLLCLRFVSAGFLVSLVVLWWSHQRKLVIMMLTLLTLANIRYVVPGSEIYSGFHILPWFGLLLFFWAEALVRSLANFKPIFKIGLITVLVVTLGVAFENGSKSIFIDKNVADELYVNYSRQFDIGEAVRIMKTPGERLLVAPDEWLVYWQADIPHASKMVNYYAWMALVPELQSQIDLLFEIGPPDYLYTNMVGTGLEKYYPRYDVLQKDGHKTSLFVRKGKWETLSVQQRNSLSYLNFSRIER